MADNDHYNKDEEGDEEEEDELDEGGYKTVKDAVLLAIEVSPSMLMPPKDGIKGNVDSPTVAALKCAFHLMQQRIISSPKDMIGILLYGTEETKFHDEEDNSRGNLTYPHCYLLTDLNIPDAGDVRALKKLVEDKEESEKLLVPSEVSVSMANVLFCANQIFTTRAANFSSRRLFIVTDNDNPHSRDKALRASATVRAKDLYDLGVIIELFPISTPDHEFDRAKFYDDIIYNSFPTDPDAPAYIKPESSNVSSADGISLLNSLLSEINSKAVARRALFSNLSLEIGPGFKISVKGYIIFKKQEAARTTYIWTHGEKPLIPKLVSKKMADDTARTVEKWEIKKAFKFGGEQIVFTPEEILSLRHFGDPGIRIIGFKPLSKLPLWASTNKSTFIYPSEEDYVGSTRVFSALQQKLLKDNKMAVTWFVARRNAVPVIAALIPGKEKYGDSGEQVVPPGLWLVQLPYADDIRQKPEMSHIIAPDELTDKMRLVVSQLQLPKAQYNPSKYPNPALQWHYRILQAIALEEDLPEKPEDKTIPKYKQIEKRAGGFIADWAAELDTQHRLVNANFHGPKSFAKRPAPLASDGSTAKKPKTEGGGDAIADNEMKRHYNSRSVGSLKVPELKMWLKAKGLEAGGLKADLIERVDAYWENK